MREYDEPLFLDIEQQLRNIHDPVVSDDDASYESKLATLHRTALALEQLTRSEVDAARSVGMSWQAIGEPLGVSRQSAHERFARPRTP